jgi:hypothetical protein
MKNGDAVHSVDKQLTKPALELERDPAIAKCDDVR